MLAALARLFRRRPRGSGQVAADRLRSNRRQTLDRAPEPGEVIEQNDLGELRIARPEAPRRLPLPAPAVFNLPGGGPRLAGMAYSPERVLYAVVQLLPDDAFWLDAARFPERSWRQVRMGGAVREVQRMGAHVTVKEPPQGSAPGHWSPYSPS